MSIRDFSDITPDDLASEIEHDTESVWDENELVHVGNLLRQWRWDISKAVTERCAKIAETYAEDIPDADQDVFKDLAAKIRRPTDR